MLAQPSHVAGLRGTRGASPRPKCSPAVNVRTVYLTGSLPLDRAIGVGTAPLSITVDHDTEFTSRGSKVGACERGVHLDYIRPGKSVERACIESFNQRQIARRMT